MTKRARTHKLQRERRRRAVEYRATKKDHVPCQIWDERGRRWLKIGQDDWATVLGQQEVES